MDTHSRALTLALAAAAATAAALPGLAATKATPQDRQTITPAFEEAIPTMPGKSLVGLLVSYPPGGSTPAHYHPHSAFVTGYVLSGSIRSQVNDGKTRVFRKGEHWTEVPGDFHPVSANASATQPASLLAIFLVDTADAGRLVTYAGK